MTTSKTARLQLLGAALLFSTGGAAIKACGLGGWTVASFRSGIAALTLLLLIPAARRLADVRVWLVGATYATTLVLYVVANKLTTAANAIFLQSTAPLYVLLLGPVLLKEPVRRRDLLFLGTLAAGMALFLLGADAPTELAVDPPRGNLLGFGAGFSWALTLMGLRWLERGNTGERGHAAAAATAGNLLACLVILPLALPIGSTDPIDWWVIGFLGVFQIGIAYALLTRGMGGVPAFEASLLLLLEPVLNPAFAWLIHGETVGGWALLGGALILGTTIARALTARRGSRPFDRGSN